MSSLRKSDFYMWGFVLAFLALFSIRSGRAAEPVLSQPLPFGPEYVQILATNCTDNSFSYVLQSSTNLQNWSAVATNPVTTTFLPYIVPTPTQPYFYRVATI